MPSTSRHKSTRNHLHVCIHNKFKHVCALRKAYSLVQLLNFHILSLQYVKCPSSLHIIIVFQITGLLRRIFFFNEEETKYVSVYLNENLKQHMQIGTSSGHVVLNDLVLHSSDIQVYYIKERNAKTWWLASHPVNLLCTAHTHHEWEHSSVSK
jgi:hypothetical protein